MPSRTIYDVNDPSAFLQEKPVTREDKIWQHADGRRLSIAEMDDGQLNYCLAQMLIRPGSVPRNISEAIVKESHDRKARRGA